jgi:SAM-dependent methyltransferase
MTAHTNASHTLAKAEKYTSAQFAQAQKTAEGRLYPSIFGSSFLVLRNRRIRMEKFFGRRQAVGKVLDVGAQYCPYYPLFKDKCESYTSMDLVDTPLVDIVCDAADMPVDDESFDLVLCTQVLEHCQDPQGIANECHRVLRTGGSLIVTVPSIFPQHGYPADNWRFMPDGLKYLLRAFPQVEVIGELDFAESLASVNCHYGHVITGRLGAVGRMLNPPWDFSTNLAALVLSSIMRPLAHRNFTAFTASLWAECRK